jgi:parallel beta-helix repeat protein
LLERNVAEDNRAVGFGILNSSDNGLDSNRATGNDINFSLGAADDNRLTDNVAQGGSEGFFISGSDNNIFAGNSAIGGSSSAAGFILDGSSGNAFTGNTATGYRLGFNTSRESSDNTFDANLASDNDQGFVDRGALGAGTSGTNNTYLDNTCSGNEFASIPPGLCPRE